MTQTEPALRLTIFIGEDDRWHHKPLHDEIVRQAHEADLAGATVLRGCEGYGRSALIHTTRLFRPSEDLPVVVVVVDREDRVRAFLSQLDDLVAEGTVLLDEIVRYPRKQSA